MTDSRHAVFIGIAICNACLKPCQVVATPYFNVESKCCKASVVHKNTYLTLGRQKVKSVK